MGPFLFDRCAGIEGSLLPVIGGSEETDPTVDTDDILAGRRIRRIRDINGHGYMEKELAMLYDKPGCAESSSIHERPFHCIRTEGTPDPSAERVDTEEPFRLICIPDEGIIPVPDEAELRDLEGRPDICAALLLTEPFGITSLVCPDCLVCGDHCAYDAGRHL